MLLLEVNRLIKTIKVKLKPNNKQRTKLFQMAGAARFAYNWALAIQQENYKNGGKFILDGALRKRFTQLKKMNEFSWLNSISNNVTKQAIKDACDAYIQFFEGKSSYPRFKSKKRSRPSFYQDTSKIQFNGTHVKLEKISLYRKKNKLQLNWIRLAEKNRIPFGEEISYYNPRITFDGLHWWISVGIESEVDFSPTHSEGIGIDLGLKDFAVVSNGEVYKNINKLSKVKKLEKKKRKLQRKVSRKYQYNKEGARYKKTCNRIKSEKQLLKLNKRLTNIRHDYLHQISSELISRKPTFIAVEDLNVKGMMKNKHLAKAVQQQCFSEFKKQIEYKCKWNNIKFVLVDRWFPSSKLCSCCGEIKSDLKLSDRIYRCACGNEIDRDYQAARNLKAYGERTLQSVS